MATRGVAILPTGMSRERFEWLDRWCENPAEDVIRTVGTESNVKEIYDECNRLALDPQNFVFNQFAEFGNHLVHYAVTGPALSHVFESYRQQVGRDVRLALMTSATGSAGTIAAGEYLKDTHGTKVLAAEALECPTLLENGFGEHNIQGIGDKHVPLIHNVMRHDLVAAVSDRATDHLEVMFNEPEGLALLAGKGVPAGRAGRARRLRVLVDLQRARRHLGRQGARPGPGRRRRHRGDRRRPALPLGAREGARARLRRRVHPARRRGGVG